jgi:hypothetical protein
MVGFQAIFHPVHFFFHCPCLFKSIHGHFQDGFVYFLAQQILVQITHGYFPSALHRSGRGKYSPTNNFSSVDLPVPLYPIRPIRSLGCICQVASRTMARAPNSKVTFVNPTNMSAKVMARKQIQERKCERCLSGIPLHPKIITKPSGLFVV